jgi:hypothetical protein
MASISYLAPWHGGKKTAAVSSEVLYRAYESTQQALSLTCRVLAFFPRPDVTIIYGILEPDRQLLHWTLGVSLPVRLPEGRLRLWRVARDDPRGQRLLFLLLVLIRGAAVRCLIQYYYWVYVVHTSAVRLHGHRVRIAHIRASDRKRCSYTKTRGRAITTPCSHLPCRLL